MDAKTFLDEFGKAEAERVAAAAGTNYAYFSQIAHRHRRPSVDMARKLVEASNNRLSFESLLMVEVRGRPAA